MVPRRRAPVNWRRGGSAILNFALLCLALALVVRPRGYVRSSYSAYRQERADRAAVRPMWSSLAEDAALVLGEGPPDLVVFSDYRCPFCSALDAQLRIVAAEHQELSVGVLFLPLSGHPQSGAALRAAACAEEQGSLRAIHPILFDPGDWEAPDWEGIAAAAGVPDLIGFRDCMSSMRPVDRVNAHRQLAEALHVTITPMVVYPTGAFRGAPSRSELEDLIEGLVSSREGRP